MFQLCGDWVTIAWVVGSGGEVCELLVAVSHPGCYSTGVISRVAPIIRSVISIGQYKGLKGGIGKLTLGLVLL